MKLCPLFLALDWASSCCDGWDPSRVEVTLGIGFHPLFCLIFPLDLPCPLAYIARLTEIGVSFTLATALAMLSSSASALPRSSSGSSLGALFALFPPSVLIFRFNKTRLSSLSCAPSCTIGDVPWGWGFWGSAWLRVVTPSAVVEISLVVLLGVRSTEGGFVES